MIMHHEARLAMCTALALVATACGNNMVGIGTDSGPRDSGVDSGAIEIDAGDEQDSGTVEVDSGEPQDSGAPDAGPPAPAYCPPAPSVGAPPSCPPLASRTEVTVTGDITADTTWSCANVVRLTGLTYVMSGTLTIEAGTQVVGDNGSALVVTQNGRIHAVGHPTAPIVFTSSRPEGSRDRGDWGGVVLLGRAPINVAGGTNNIEGIPATELRGTYGGTAEAHDCGTVSWARIEFAGYTLGAGNELNGLTLGGCGSATLVDHVQVHRGRDDAFEMFGGSPNLRYLVASGMDDDGLDWDFGYVGNIQYAIVQRYTDSNSSDPNGIEADNNGSANDATPRSNPSVYNVTLIGTNSSAVGTDIGTVLRRGTYATIRNFIVTGFTRFGTDVRDASSETAAGTSLVLSNGIYHMNAMDLQSTVETAAFMTLPTAMNRFGVDPMLGAPFDDVAPDFAPMAGSPTATGAAAPAGAFFDAESAYVGAIGPGCTDWTAGWTAYPVD
jgi:hypothetical protein